MRDSVRRVFLDTCIFMYAAGRKHPLKEPCLEVLRAVAQGKVRGVIDTEVIQEILYRHQRLNLLEKGVRMARNALTIAHETLSVEEEDVRNYIELFEKYASKGIKARDLVHAAVMIRAGIEEIISVDKDFDEIERIRRIDPRSFPL